MGTVFDQRTLDPVPHVFVTLINAAGDVVAGGLSDEFGSVLIEARPGRYFLRVRSMGWSAGDSTLFVVSADPVEVDVPVNRIPLSLESVNIAADGESVPAFLEEFHERRRAGYGAFLTGEEIMSKSPTVVTDALRNLPGVRVVRTAGGGYTVRILSRLASSPGDVGREGGGRGTPGCPPMVYIDNIPVGNADANLNEWVLPSEVAGIEVYRRASEFPPRYGGARANCGLVIVWTRRGPPQRR